MTYQAPLEDISFALKYGAGLAPAVEEGLFGDLTIDVVDAVLAEAGRLAGEVIAPLNRVGDEFGTPIKDGVVTTAPGWKEAYRTWRDGGWNGLAAPAEWGGQALPQSIAENDNSGSVENVFSPEKIAAQSRGDAENMKEAGAHALAFEPLRLFAAG